MSLIRSYKLFFAAMRSGNYELAQKINATNKRFKLFVIIELLEKSPNVKYEKYKANVKLDEQIVKGKRYNLTWLIYNKDCSIITGMIIYSIPSNETCFATLGTIKDVYHKINEEIPRLSTKLHTDYTDAIWEIHKYFGA